jgi:hypothetical protein
MTQDTQTRLTGLILYAIRELQGSIQYDPERHAHNLKEYYGVEIDEDAIAHELEDIAETINSEDRELLAA